MNVWFLAARTKTGCEATKSRLQCGNIDLSETDQRIAVCKPQEEKEHFNISVLCLIQILDGDYEKTAGLRRKVLPSRDTLDGLEKMIKDVKGKIMMIDLSTLLSRAQKSFIKSWFTTESFLLEWLKNVLIVVQRWEL